MLSLFGTSFAGIEYGTSRAYSGNKIIKETINYNQEIPLKIAVVNNDEVHYLKELRRKDNAVEVFIDDEKKKHSNNIKINIEKSETGKAYVQVRKEAEARKRDLATENAADLTYNYEILDNKLIFNAYFLSSIKNMWKDEAIEITIFIPESTVIYFENSSKKFLYDIDNTDNIYDTRMAKHHFKMTSIGFECMDCSKSSKKDKSRNTSKNNNINLSFLFDSTINQHKAEFIIDKKTSKESLQQLIHWFKNKKNIDIDIVESNFKNNQIKQLKLNIDCNDGYKGTVEINNNTLKEISKGFVRRYNDDETPFKT